MIRQTLFTGWNFIRWFRLGFGVFWAAQAIQTHDSLSGFIAVFFLFQAITNTGCCGVNGCAMPITKNKSDKIEEIEYQEIKTK